MSTVTLTRDGLSIDGRLVYLLAGQLHYFRYPQAEWRDQLLKARAGGLNAIDTVIPWNLHEPVEGVFNFDDEADLPGYLDLCAELGLLAIVRPDPYICAEWENGGFPAWLTAKPGLELRVDNPVYVEYTRRWFDRLMPLLAERQATRGGPIVLCQIENEHWASGRYGHDAHQQTLAQLAIEHGMDVPQYTCMGAMRGYAEFRNGWSGIAEKLQQTRALWPDNPMIVSELWSGWFDNWGAGRHNHKTAARLDLTMHQLAAVGASGVSHWVWAGGTSFGYWGGRTVGGDTIHMTTSYDYDAPVSEYGGLTEKFFTVRRHHLFLGSLGARLAPNLANAAPGGPKVIGPAAVAGRGEAGSAPYRNLRAGPGAPAAWADFSTTFLHNQGQEGQTYQVFLAKPAVHLAVDVEAGAIKPIFANLPLREANDERRTTNDPPVMGDERSAMGESESRDAGGRGHEDDARSASLVLEYHTSRILGFWEREDGDWLVLYGREGEAGRMQVRLPHQEVSLDKITWNGTNVDCSARDAQWRVQYWITDRPTVLRSSVGRPLTIVLLTRERAERWWLAGDGFVCGPHLVLSQEQRTGRPGDRETGEEESGEEAVESILVIAHIEAQAPGGGAPESQVEHAAIRIDRRGVLPFYHVGSEGQLQMFSPAADPAGDARSPLVWQSQAIASPFPPSPTAALIWIRHDVAERTADAGWQAIQRPTSMEELGCNLGYGWYRADLAVDVDTEATLAAPWIADRARVLLDGVDIGWLGVHPNGPRLTLPLRLTAGRHDLRLLLDNLGRFNYGSNTGERKGLLDTLYLGGRQIDMTGGWTALWQEAVFAGEALAGAKPAFVRPDARDVSLDNFAFQGPGVWLLREFAAEPGKAYLLYLTGDRNPGALFVNGVNLSRFSRHYGGGYIKQEITHMLRPGANVLALNIQGYAGAHWRATLLEFDPAGALAAEWSFRAGVGYVGETVATDPASITHHPTAGPCFWRTTFGYDSTIHGAGPFKLALPGMRKGQIWLNGHNAGRYWHVGPQEFYKLPASWLQAENELLLFDEEGATPNEVWIGVDALGTDQTTLIESGTAGQYSSERYSNPI